MARDGANVAMCEYSLLGPSTTWETDRRVRHLGLILARVCLSLCKRLRESLIVM